MHGDPAARKQTQPFLPALVMVGAMMATACGAPPTDGDFHGPEPVGTVQAGLTVDQSVSAGCSTTAVAGLNQQIIAEMNCLIPGGALKPVPARPNFKKGGATLAWMQPAAVDALVKALDAHSSTTFTANSMLRTVAGQYLLYRWYQKGTCGISLAASPGTSNHESGLAIDVHEYSTWKSALTAQGFSWLGSSDPVHYDYAGPGTVNLKGKDVLAFQKLWNLNNPNDLIAEDGIYGPQTGARLAKSPAGGFATGPSCGSGGSGGTGGTGGSGGGTGTGGSSAGGSGGSATAGGAGGTAGTDGTDAICTPGKPAVCACPGSQQGYQLCNTNGTGYDACSCFGAAGAGGGNPATRTIGGKSGCSCGVPGRTPADVPWLAALALGALALVRSRRNRASDRDA